MLAWVRASAAALLEGDAEPRRGVALLDEVRAFGLRGASLGLALLATATRGGNDRLAMKLLAQHAEQGLRGDAHYLFAAGAALELACDELATERFRSAVEAAPSAVLPRVRLVRNHLVHERFEEARRALEPLAPRPERAVLAEAIVRLSGSAKFTQVVDVLAIPDLLRSVRPIAQALLQFDANQGSGIDAALEDVDGPEAAMIVAKLVLSTGDRLAAKRAAESALRLRPEFSPANELLVRLEEKGALPPVVDD